MGFAASYPPIHAWLGAPIVSPNRSYGWLGLIDKIGAEVFSEEDERLAGILAAQVGRIYENGSLYGDLLRHAADLELEISRTQALEDGRGKRKAVATRDRFQSGRAAILWRYRRSVRPHLDK